MNQVKKEKIKGKEVKQRYYVMPVDEIGQTFVIKGNNPPADMTGVISVDLPAGYMVSVTGHDRDYLAYQIAISVARGNTKIEEVGPGEE